MPTPSDFVNLGRPGYLELAVSIIRGSAAPRLSTPAGHGIRPDTINAGVLIRCRKVVENLSAERLLWERRWWGVEDRCRTGFCELIRGKTQRGVGRCRVQGGAVVG